jgi:hypothetical protein
VAASHQSNQRIDVFTAVGGFVRTFGKNVGGTGVNTCTTSPPWRLLL